MKVSGGPNKAVPLSPPSSTVTKPHRSSEKGRNQRAIAHSSEEAAVSNAAKAGPVSLNSSDKWDGASLADFTRWNETAMEALRTGDVATSRQILTSVLPELRDRLADIESLKGPAALNEVVLQSWRLVYALTLNNYGCQLRRDGQSDAALQQFLAARDVEAMVFGKPSCSTMLNLSAVLLSKGEAKSALKIATECAAAAQDGEPVLFITALHNLAVALGQQTSERSRSAALPTMLQALREAQSALGEQHPTTKMLKEKCGLTSQWIHSEPAAATQPQLAKSPMVRGSSAKPAAASPQPEGMSTEHATSAQERARAALYTLDFGVPRNLIAAPAAAVHPTVINKAASQTTGLNKSDHGEALAPALAKKLSPGPWEQTSQVGNASNTSPIRLPPLSLPKKHGVLRASGDVRSSSNNVPAAVEGEAHRDSNVAASVDKLCLNSANLPSMGASTPKEGLETVLQEPFRPLALSLNHHGATTLRDLCAIEQKGSFVYPSFLRFSAQLPPMSSLSVGISTNKTEISKTTQPHGSNSVACLMESLESSNNKNVFAQTAPVGANVLHRASASNTLRQPHNGGKGNQSNSVFSIAPSVQESEAQNVSDTISPSATSSAKGNSGRSTQPTARRTLFGHHGSGTTTSSSRWSDKAARRQADLEEEQAYRRKLKEEEAAAETARAFEVGLEKVKIRTQSRAAGVIQRVWRRWWTSVGRPRRHVQMQHLEELQRLRRDRLALASTKGGKRVPAKSYVAAGSLSPSWRQQQQQQQQHGRIAGHVVPAVVVRCATKWLARTACVRCAARLTSCAVAARIHEADLRQRICRVQAHWRGVLQRRRDREDKQRERATAAAAAKAEIERCEYAAMVLQCAYRRHAAQRARQRLYEVKYAAPAMLIQQWLRRTWADKQQRGVDAPTWRRRNAASLCIQRVWRGYQGRVAFHMRELRQRINQTNSDELAKSEKTNENGISVTSMSAEVPRTDEVAEAQNRAALQPSCLSSPQAQPDPSSLSTKTANEYEANCLQRSTAVRHLHDEERDHFHIPLYVETVATKERTAWAEAVRLRSTDVVRRRAQLNSALEAEQAYFVRHRAARVIQRAYRQWNAMRHDTARDSSLLQYSLLRYQQRELGNTVAKQQHARDVDRAVQFYGDTIAPVRAERALVAIALAAAERDVEKGPGGNGVLVKSSNGPTTSLQFSGDLARRSQWRREQEAVLRRDERLLALTQAHDAAHLREGPKECKARLGTMYEHPYYNPYVNEEHRVTLGID